MFSYGAARRLLCSSSQRPLSRRARVYYSHSALSSLTRLSIREACTSETTRTVTWDGSCHVVTDTQNPLEASRLDHYLTVANLEPTLADVERCRPGRFSLPDSPRYAAEYTDLLETLCRSFSKDQLRRFTELYGLDPIWSRSSRRKTEYAESIIEKAWGWPSLKELERKRRDISEVLVKSFVVTPGQLFLIMGKDGADLLQLSAQYNVHISLTSSPLALRVEGLRGSLKGLSEYFTTFKKNIIDKTCELPTGRSVRSDLLQRISRLSDAYVENQGNRGKVRICAKDAKDLAVAERLAFRASLEVEAREHTVCYNPPSILADSPIEPSESRKYALYPFITPYTHPWTMRPGGAFRLRRVADWLGTGSHEDMPSTGSLADNEHCLLNLNNGAELGQLVCTAMAESDRNLYPRETITASLGHVLISSGNSTRDSILPPYKGTSSLPDVLGWVENPRTPLVFVPSTPLAMATVKVDEQRILHRLIYKTLPQNADQDSKLPQYVLKFEMELFCSSPSTQLAQLLGNAGPSAGASWASSGSQVSDIREAICKVGREASINLMSPDRPLDIQFCIFHWKGITSIQQPQLLQDYADKLRDSLISSSEPLSQPNPPSTFRYEEREYYLYDNLNLKQSNNMNLLASSHYADDEVRVTKEIIADLQSIQKRELCQVNFSGSMEMGGWKRFLAICDLLSVESPDSRRKRREQFAE